VACDVRSRESSLGGEELAVGERVAGDEAFSTWWSPGELPATRRASFTGYPFTLGVASGEPVSSGVVLWTRLAPEPLRGGGVGADPVVVGWEVAEDESFGRVVQRGSVVARGAWAHSVHVEVSGLEPARWYVYRFLAGDEVSPVGRTRTAPAVSEFPERWRFGLGSCQHFEQGFYAAHRHLKAEDLDVMVFVGDYIYEGPGLPAACAVTWAARRERWWTTATATRSTRPIRTCSACTPPCRGW
jgi:alkaline phosphatase D